MPFNFLERSSPGSFVFPAELYVFLLLPFMLKYTMRYFTARFYVYVYGNVDRAVRF